MPRIKIVPSETLSCASGLDSNLSQLNGIASQISSASSRLNWSVKSKSNIDSSIQNALNTSKNLSSEIGSLSSYIKNATNRLVEADNKSANFLGKIYISFEKHLNNKLSIQDQNPYFYDWPVPGRDLEVEGKKDGRWGIIRKGVSTDKPNGHQGIDIWGDEGDWIVSAHGGTIFNVYNSETYGNTVFVDTEIDGIKYQLRYAHLKELPILSVGENINAGEVIGLMGHTGSANGINHLHFEVRKFTRTDLDPLNGEAINPEDFHLDMQTKSTEWHKDLKYKQPDFSISNEQDSSAKLK